MSKKKNSASGSQKERKSNDSESKNIKKTHREDWSNYENVTKKRECLLL